MTTPTWMGVAHDFTCGACGTKVTGIVTRRGLSDVMREHSELCPGVAPTKGHVDAVIAELQRRKRIGL